MTRFLVLAAILTSALAACSPQRALEAAWVLGDMAAGGMPSRLKRTTAAPDRTALLYRVGGEERVGDLYLPGDGALAALVLVPGIAREGKDDPRLVAFATTLARARFLVLVPDIENLRRLEVHASDAREVASAVRHLSDRGPVGIVAFSYAAGPAVLAALGPDVGGRVAFIVAVGGYFDITAAVTFFTTGYFRDPPGGPWRWRAPNAFGKWVFVHSNAGRVADARDRTSLKAMAERKLDDLDADISDLAAELGAQGRAVHALLANRDPDKVPGLIAALPAQMRRAMTALDLKTRDLSKLESRLILVHGRDDAIIPASESRALAAAAPAGRADLYIVGSLAHVDLDPAGIIDRLTLWRAVYRLLEERDRLATPGANLAPDAHGGPIVGTGPGPAWEVGPAITPRRRSPPRA